MGGAIVLKSLKKIFRRKPKRKDDEEDEDEKEVNEEPEETESLCDTLTAGLASILPFQGRTRNGRIINPVALPAMANCFHGSLTSTSSSSSLASSLLVFLTKICLSVFNTIAAPIVDDIA